MRAADLVVPVTLVLVPISVFGLVADRHGWLLIPVAVVAVGGLLLTLSRPAVAILAALTFPFLDVPIDRSLAGIWVLMMLVAATLRMWPQAHGSARSGALLIAGLGCSSLLFGVAFDGLSKGAGSIALAVTYATLTGVCAAVMRPSAFQISCNLVGVGVYASIIAILTPALAADRGTIIVGTNANGVGFIAGLGFVAGLTLLRKARPQLNTVFAASSAVCAVGVFLSESRGALVSAVVGLAMLLLHRLIQARGMRTSLTLACLAALTYALAGPVSGQFVKVVGREQAIAEASTEVRQELLIYAIKTGAAHPVTGIGLGGLTDFSLADPMAGFGLRAHNVFAGVFAETGTLTLTLLLVLSFVACRRARAHGVRNIFPLVLVVLVNGLSLEWWGSTGTGPLALAVLGTAVSMSPRGSLPSALAGTGKASPASIMRTSMPKSARDSATGTAGQASPRPGGSR